MQEKRNNQNQRRQGGDRRVFDYSIVFPDRRKWNRRLFDRRGLIKRIREEL